MEIGNNNRFENLRKLIDKDFIKGKYGDEVIYEKPITEDLVAELERLLEYGEEHGMNNSFMMIMSGKLRLPIENYSYNYNGSKIMFEQASRILYAVASDLIDNGYEDAPLKFGGGNTYLYGNLAAIIREILKRMVNHNIYGKLSRTYGLTDLLNNPLSEEELQSLIYELNASIDEDIDCKIAEGNVDVDELNYEREMKKKFVRFSFAFHNKKLSDIKEQSSNQRGAR